MRGIGKCLGENETPYPLMCSLKSHEDALLLLLLSPLRSLSASLILDSDLSLRTFSLCVSGSFLTLEMDCSCSARSLKLILFLLIQFTVRQELLIKKKKKRQFCFS